MLSTPLQTKIDRNWQTLWTAGLTSPITVLEQISYLLFMKILDDDQIRKEQTANTFKSAVSKPVFKTGVCVISETPRVEMEYSRLRWSNFKHDAPDVLFKHIQNYVFPFIKTLGMGHDTIFSRYMENAVFLIPTAKSLSVVVDDIDAMDMSNKDIMGDVYEELLKKIASAGDNGQFRTPRHIIDMIVELMEPTIEDKIVDPAMGSAGFLIAASRKVAQGCNLTNKQNREKFNRMFSGFDTDPSMLRIGVMNMMLHGVEEPNIQYQDSVSEDNHERSEYTLVMANPPFAGNIFKEQIAKDLLAITHTSKTELLFVALFTKLLKVGGRCASIVPDGVLFGSSKAHQALRRELVEHQALQAVISMPSGVFKPYAGVSTAVLVFTKTDNGGTDKVWFYEMKADGFSLDDKRTEIPENDIPDLIAKFRQRKSLPMEDRAAKCFFVSKEEIVANNYDLSINKYKKVEYVAEQFPPTDELLSEIEELEKKFREQLAELRRHLQEDQA